MQARPLRLLLCTLLLTACATPARLPPLSEVKSTSTPVLYSADGPLSPEQSRAILRDSQSGPAQVKACCGTWRWKKPSADMPLVIGNKVTLLRDGPATYRAMYEAIREGQGHINLET